MSTEIELHTESQQQSPLAVQMDYARAVASASMLPENYRGKPADIMLAVGLGQSMGLSPAESLYRISVIKGKPTASAELIAANVRKAGHRLRVRGDEQSCTATIIRADDPDYEFTVTRDLAWAQRMGLADQPNYRKQPGTMLQWRAISAVARLACPEALYGVSYTPDEMGDVPEQRTGGLAAALGGTEVAPEPTQPGAELAPEPPDSAPITSAQLQKIGILCGELGLSDAAEARREVGAIIGREIKSRKDLTKAEAHRVIDRFESLQQHPFPDADEPVEGELVS